MERVRFEDIVTRVNTKEDRFSTDKIYYVGGEHIESNDIKVHQRGIIKGSTIGPMFYCGFKAGDVLFVTRNPHLRKCAIVDFDGICSEKTFVLGTKDPTRLLQEYLPLIMQSNDFWAYCEENKSGGVNFFVNWSTLANYEFELPSLEEQRVLADKLWAAYEVKESYKNLLTQTDKLLHAQFYKMFGDETQYRKIADVFTLQMGKTPSRDIPTYFGDEGHTWLSIADMKEDAIFTSASKEKLTDLAIKDCGIKIVPCNTVIMSFKLTVGRLAITNEDLYTNEAIMAFLPKDNSYRTKFVYYLFQHIQWLGDAKLAIKGNTLNKESISNILLPIIGIERQDDFLHIAEQAEQTKATLNKGIAAIEAVIRSLIAEGTTKI